MRDGSAEPMPDGLHPLLTDRMVRFPRVRVWLEQLLHTHDTPQRTAFAYALGVFLGFSPVLGSTRSSAWCSRSR